MIFHNNIHFLAVEWVFGQNSVLHCTRVAHLVPCFEDTAIVANSEACTTINFELSVSRVVQLDSGFRSARV